MTEQAKPITQSLTPIRRRENAQISKGLKGKNALALTEENRQVATLMVTVTRLLDPRFQLLILKGAGYPIEGSVTDITGMETTLEKED